MNRLLIGIAGFLVCSITLATLASANLVVDPARLGILRLQLFPLSPAVAVREFEVGNTYDVPMSVELSPVEDMIGLVTIPEANFTLQSNENKTVEYTVTVNEPGYYSGGIMVKANIEGRGTLGYTADLEVIVTKSNMEPYIYAGIIVVIAVAAIALVLLFRKSRTKRGKRNAR
jgi:hypothetical protein